MFRELRNTLIALAILALFLPVAALALNHLLPLIIVLTIVVGVFAVIFRPRR